MRALIQVLFGICLLVWAGYVTYMWANTHDPNYGIMLTLTMMFFFAAKD